MLHDMCKMSGDMDTAGRSPSAQRGPIWCAMPQLKESKAYSCLTGSLPKTDSGSNRAPKALYSWNYFCAQFQLSVLVSVSLNNFKSYGNSN